MNLKTNGLAFDRLSYLNAILRTLPDAVAIYDKDRRLIEINPAGLAMAGAQSIAELSDRPSFEWVEPGSLPAFLESFDATLRAANDGAGPLRIDAIARNGERQPFEIRMARLNGPDGTAAGVVITARDITAADGNVNSLAIEQSLIHAILDTVPDAMIVIDEYGLIMSFSAAAEKLFGYREADIVGLNVSMLMSSPHRELHDGYLRRYRETGEKRIIGIGRMTEARHRDGTVFPIELAIGEAQSGDHRAFTGFVRDLSKRFETEEKLRLVQAELVHATRLSTTGAMASGLAHELNQPLTSITNYVSAGRDMLDSADPGTREIVREALDEAAKEAVRAGQIVRRLREFVSKGDGDKRVLSLGNLVNDANALGLVGAREKGIEWWIDIDPEVDSVLADRIQIQQVMVNLLRNSIEAMEGCATKHLTVRARPSGSDLVEISVEDSGTGITPEVLKNLFQPFTSTKAHGMGLGLSICRTIIEAHGGRLEAETGDEGGCNFRFTLMRAFREDESGS